MDVVFRWSEAKRVSNRLKHELDFTDTARVFAGLTWAVEDERTLYSAQRCMTLGLLKEVPVCIIHIHDEFEIRIISFRKATRHEARLFFEEVGD